MEKSKLSGVLASGFYGGTRSEYFASYILSAFGSAQAVSRQEDYGIDFQCTLGSVIGKRYHVEHYYFAQVKSDEKPISYHESSSLEWLLNLPSPLLFCIIDKEASKVRVYASAGISMLEGKSHLEKVEVHFESLPDEVQQHYKNNRPLVEFNNNRAQIYMGEPILNFHITALEKKETREHYQSILKYWVSILHENIQSNMMGFTFHQQPRKYQSNSLPGIDKEANGNLLLSFESDEVKDKHFDSLFKALSIQIYHASNEQKTDFCEVLIKTSLEFVKIYDPQKLDKLGLNALLSNILSASKHLKIEVDPLVHELVGYPEVDIELVNSSD